MGLLDKLEKKKRPVLQPIRSQHSTVNYDTNWLTPHQFARQQRKQDRQMMGLIIFVVGWVIGLVVSLIPLAWPLGLTVGVLFTVWAVLTAFSNSDKELKRHARWTWREFKSLFKQK